MAVSILFVIPKLMSRVAHLIDSLPGQLWRQLQRQGDRGKERVGLGRGAGRVDGGGVAAGRPASWLAAGRGGKGLGEGPIWPHFAWAAFCLQLGKGTKVKLPYVGFVFFVNALWAHPVQAPALTTTPGTTLSSLTHNIHCHHHGCHHGQHRVRELGQFLQQLMTVIQGDGQPMVVTVTTVIRPPGANEVQVYT